MSHFSVLVIGENPDEKMAPYQENNMGDCPREYMEFNDMTEELKEEWENGKKKEWYPSDRMIVTEVEYNAIKNKDNLFMKHYKPDTRSLDSGKVENNARIAFMIEYPEEKWRDKEHPRWSEAVYGTLRNVTKDEQNKTCDFEVIPIDPPNEIPKSDGYDTFEEFVEDYHGYKLDEEMGVYGYWENPNRKWDWYQLGGRWLGSFKKKHENSKSEEGKPGAFDNDSLYDTDQIRKGDIDWEYMNNDPEQKKKLEENWDEVVIKKKGFYKPEYYLEQYGDKETYLKMELEFSTYAVVTEDGEWHEPGKMGWWGVSHADIKQTKEFKQGYFARFIEHLPDDTLLTVFDCHI